jgi:hypothetical protein
MRLRLIEDPCADECSGVAVHGVGLKAPAPQRFRPETSMVAPGAPPRGAVLDYPSRLFVYRRYFVT